MINETIGKLGDIVINTMLTLFAFSLFMYFLQLGRIDSFKQDVNRHIERYGGLTEESIDSIYELSRSSYSNNYRIESERLGEQVDYGEIVEYKVIGEFKIMFFDLPDQVIPLRGSAASHIRKSND